MASCRRWRSTVTTLAAAAAGLRRLQRCGGGRSTPSARMFGALGTFSRCQDSVGSTLRSGTRSRNSSRAGERFARNGFRCAPRIHARRSQRSTLRSGGVGSCIKKASLKCAAVGSTTGRNIPVVKPSPGWAASPSVTHQQHSVRQSKAGTRRVPPPPHAATRSTASRADRAS